MSDILLVPMATPKGGDKMLWLAGEEMRCVEHNVTWHRPLNAQPLLGTIFVTNFRVAFRAFESNVERRESVSSQSSASSRTRKESNLERSAEFVPTGVTVGSGHIGMSYRDSSGVHDVDVALASIEAVNKPSSSGGKGQSSTADGTTATPMTPATGGSAAGSATPASSMGSTATADGDGRTALLEIEARNMQVLRFSFPRSSGARNTVYNVVTQVAFPALQAACFAFKHASHDGSYPNGWHVYNGQHELARIGIPNAFWRFTTANENYKLCPTYSNVMAVPFFVSDEQLRAIAAFRSRARLPILSWLHPASKAALVRCAQPLSGIKGKRCPEDELYVEAMKMATPRTKQVTIVDMRPLINAVANQAMGKGYESSDTYGCACEFMDVENIHVMRTSVQKLRDACVTADDDKFFINVGNSGWLDHVSLVLRSAVRVADLLSSGVSVLTHCSDGWDRTAQLTSLTQILLDPYYRTIRGFIVLIEKEWLSAGHMFALRLGMIQKSQQQSPVFLQFIDCVWQIQQQFPKHFEFSSRFLLDIIDGAHSGRYGTFMTNCEQDRARLHLIESTTSLWTALERKHKEDPATYANPFYGPVTLCQDINVASVAKALTLRPKYAVPQLKVWSELYMRDYICPHSRNMAGDSLRLPNAAVSVRSEAVSKQPSVANVGDTLDVAAQDMDDQDYESAVVDVHVVAASADHRQDPPPPAIEIASPTVSSTVVDLPVKATPGEDDARAEPPLDLNDTATRMGTRYRALVARKQQLKAELDQLRRRTPTPTPAPSPKAAEGEKSGSAFSNATAAAARFGLSLDGFTLNIVAPEVAASAFEGQSLTRDAALAVVDDVGDDELVEAVVSNNNHNSSGSSSSNTPATTAAATTTSVTVVATPAEPKTKKGKNAGAGPGFAGGQVIHNGFLLFKRNFQWKMLWFSLEQSGADNTLDLSYFESREHSTPLGHISVTDGQVVSGEQGAPHGGMVMYPFHVKVGNKTHNFKAMKQNEIDEWAVAFAGATTDS